MSVKLHIHPILYHFTDNQSVIEVNGHTVGECLDELVARFPAIKPQLFGDRGNLFNYFEIYVNEESAYPEELVKRVKDGDDIYLVVMLSGG